MTYKFFYGRISTADQNPARQYAEARECGIPDENVFIDIASSRDFSREQYSAMLSRLRAGDELYISSLDRLGRTYRDTVDAYKHITRDLHAVLIIRNLPILSSAADPLTAALIGDVVIQLLSYVAESEYRSLHERQIAGIEAAKARGAYAGRQPVKVDVPLFEKVYREVKSGVRTARSAASTLKVSPSTFLRLRKEYDTHSGRFSY